MTKIKIELGKMLRINLPSVDRVFTGEVVKKFPANFPVSKEDMLFYYSLREGERNFKQLSRPYCLDRYALQKFNGYYFIFPDNSTSNYIIIEEDK